MAIIQREMLSSRGGDNNSSTSSEMMMIIPTSTTYSKWEGRKESVEVVTMIGPKECVKFDETVQIRSYERILCEDPISAYAGFVLGWDYKDELKKGSLTGGDETDDDDDSDATVRTSGTTSSADTAKEDCQREHHNRFKSSIINDKCGTIRATRYTASERVKILSGYGFKMSEIIKLEFTKREQRDNMIAQEKQRQKQQRKFSSTIRNTKDERYANYIPSSSSSSSSSSLSQSTRRLSQTLRKKILLKKNNKRRVNVNAWTE